MANPDGDESQYLMPPSTFRDADDVADQCPEIYPRGHIESPNYTFGDGAFEVGADQYRKIYLCVPHSEEDQERYAKLLLTPAADQGLQRRYRDLDEAIRRGKLEYLLFMQEQVQPVNLSGDPLLSVVIAYEKSDLAIQLIREIREPEQLLAKNFEGDTALHVAAAKGDVRVAEALVRRCDQDQILKDQVLNARNESWETPMHKAAMFGGRRVFWRLDQLGGHARNISLSGATMLHCAIMANEPALAFGVAIQYPDLAIRRNHDAVTPLQLILTVPDMFPSQQALGTFASLAYRWIPVSKEDLQEKMPADLRKKHSDLYELVEDIKEEQFLRRLREKFPSATFFNLLDFAHSLVKWARLLVFYALRKLPTKIKELERQKKRHKHAAMLVAQLAKDPGYWDFIVRGRQLLIRKASIEPPTFESEEPTFESEEEVCPPTFESVKEFCRQLIRYLQKNVLKEKKETRWQVTRWEDSPLILGAKMGLVEFVKPILQVCPLSTHYLDLDGKNFLQVAIEAGHEEIVRIVEKLTSTENPKIPAQLLSRIHEGTGNTILHFAAETTVEEAAAIPLQIQYELQWFERVSRLLPNNLNHNRNRYQKTAKELFTEKHKDMVKNAKEYLMEMGKTCSGLLAAVVFASSFSIPGQGASNNSQLFEKTAFKIFSNAYVVGLSCAATSLVFFMSLLISPYREQDFRRSLPLKYFFAVISFVLAMVSLLVAFSCNIYLSLYGQRKAETKHVVPFVLELTFFPAVCLLVLLFFGANIGSGTFFRRVWR